MLYIYIIYDMIIKLIAINSVCCVIFWYNVMYSIVIIIIFKRNIISLFC